jgi:hypothetical protein
VVDIIQNEFRPNCSTSRLLKGDFKEVWLGYIDIYKVGYEPRVLDWNPYRDPGRFGEAKEASDVRK